MDSSTAHQSWGVDAETIHLAMGRHVSPQDGFCVVELSAYLAGEAFTDHPAGVSPVIAAFLRAWNDTLDDQARQRLKPYATAVIGTAADAGTELRRSLRALDWVTRVLIPIWLNAAGLHEQAHEVEM